MKMSSQFRSVKYVGYWASDASRYCNPLDFKEMTGCNKFAPT